ncbi:MAG: hypothetical protein ABIQ74_10865 [Chitinophagales bacterium]
MQIKFASQLWVLFISLNATAYCIDSPKVSSIDSVKLSPSKIKPYTVNCIASFSYSSFINSPVSSVNVIALEANCFATYRQKLFNYDILHTLRTEFGYQHLFDSLWIKSKDALVLQSTWVKQSNKTFRWTHSIQTVTQYAHTSVLAYKPDGLPKQVAIAGFLSPLTIDAGSGMSISFWNTSFVNFNFVAAKFIFRNLKYDTLQIPFELYNYFPMGKKELIGINLGYNLQVNINKMVSKDLNWLCFGSAFAGGFKNQFVMLDIDNRLTYQFLKYCKVSVDHHLLFNPLFTKKLQSLQQIMLGVGF